MPLNPEKVPRELRELIPLAEEFGISDDGYRWKKIKKTKPKELDTLKRVIEENDDELDRWLAGPEADGQDFSDEYIAFSALRMAADLA